MAGSKDGITAIQMDIKNKSKPETMSRPWAGAGIGRILDTRRRLCRTRAKNSRRTHRAFTIHDTKPEKIREVIGPGGKIIKGIRADGVKIDIEDSGIVRIVSQMRAANAPLK
jgi:polyribonucleotide nucleotidyltransferase